MKQPVFSDQTSKVLHKDTNIIKTTLYELIAAVSEEVERSEEKWIPFIVNHMIGSVGSVSKNKANFHFMSLKN